MNDVITGTGYLGSNFPKCERNGVDQGVHNVLVHKKLIPNMKVFKQADGPVANLQAKLSRVQGTQVFNQAGKLVAVVHQYDRYPELQKKLFAEVSSIILSFLRCYLDSLLL